MKLHFECHLPSRVLWTEEMASQVERLCDRFKGEMSPMPNLNAKSFQIDFPLATLLESDTILLQLADCMPTLRDVEESGQIVFCSTIELDERRIGELKKEKEAA